MAKSAYIGVDGVAKKIKKMYVGDANGVARKVKKAYVGDANGVARLFYSGDAKYQWIYLQKASSTTYFWKSWDNGFSETSASLTLIGSHPETKIAFFKGKYYMILGGGSSSSTYNRVYSSTDLGTWTLNWTIPAVSAQEYRAQHSSIYSTDNGSYLIINIGNNMNSFRAWTSDGINWSSNVNLSSSTPAIDSSLVSDGNYVVSSSKPTDENNGFEVYKANLSDFMSEKTSISTLVYSQPSYNTSSWMTIYRGCLYFVEYKYWVTSISITSTTLYEYNLSTNQIRSLSIPNISTTSAVAVQSSIYCEGDYLYCTGDYLFKVQLSTMTLMINPIRFSGNTYPTRKKGIGIKNEKLWIGGLQNTQTFITWYANKNTLELTSEANTKPPRSYTGYAVALQIE